MRGQRSHPADLGRRLRLGTGRVLQGLRGRRQFTAREQQGGLNKGGDVQTRL